MSETPRYYLGLCGIAKDETPYLREWVEYHRLIGFEHFYLYDNESAVPIEETLADMWDSGLLDSFNVVGKGRQLTAYNHCLRHYGKDCEWLAFFDLDEFLSLKNGNDARALLADYEDFGGLAVNLAGFNSGGHLARPEGLVLENFTGCFRHEITVKCIVRPRFVDLPLTPHHFIYTDDTFAVNADKIPAYGGYAPVATEKVRLNHYSFRSQQDYEDKIRRGDAIYTEINPRDMHVFYWQAGHAWEAQTDMQRHLPRVREAVAAGQGRAYFPLDSKAVRSEPFAAALGRLAKALESGDTGLAHLIFCLSRRRFNTKPSYLTLGVSACLRHGDTATARAAALDLLRCAPSLGSYQSLLQVALAESDTREAGRLAAFILQAAKYEENEEAERAVRDLARENGLELA